MTLLYIGFGLMTIAAIWAGLDNHLLRIKNRSLAYSNTKFREWTMRLEDSDHDLRRLINNETYVREVEGPLPYFELCREGKTGDVPLLRAYYDMNDAEDREYKRLFITERMEAMNERP